MNPRADEAARTEVTPVRIDRYAVFDELGRGGMAQVHLARLYGPVSFSRIVAFKRMLPEATSDGEYVAMLIDEARLGARIRHPNVVSVLDVVQTGAELGLVMDYVHGPSLAWLLRRVGSRSETIPHPVVLRIAIDVLYGLHAAHEAKNERGVLLELVHRDVSPQNVLLGSDGLSRLADFGIAKAIGRLARSSAGEIRGKLRYMAPEQLLGEPLDRRVDLFAFGAVLWEMLTSRGLFDPAGEDYAQISARILSAPIPPPSTAAAVPAALDALTMKLLERDPSARYATAEAAAVLFERAGLPIATHAEVGRWLASVADDMLAERSAMLEAVEQVSRAFSVVSPPGEPGGLVPARAATGPVTPTVTVATAPHGPTPVMPTERMAPAAPPGGPTMMSPAVVPASPPVARAEPAPRPRALWPFFVVGALLLVATLGVLGLTTGRRRGGHHRLDPSGNPGAPEASGRVRRHGGGSPGGN